MGMLTVGVPPVVAGAPREAGGEGGDEVEERPGEDHVVVDADEAGHQEHGVAEALEERRDRPDRDWSLRGVLAEGELHDEERQPDEQQHDRVRDEEGACESGFGLNKKIIYLN